MLEIGHCHHCVITHYYTGHILETCSATSCSEIVTAPSVWEKLLALPGVRQKNHVAVVALFPGGFAAGWFVSWTKTWEKMEDSTPYDFGNLQVQLLPSSCISQRPWSLIWRVGIIFFRSWQHCSLWDFMGTCKLRVMLSWLRKGRYPEKGSFAVRHRQNAWPRVNCLVKPHSVSCSEPMYNCVHLHTTAGWGRPDISWFINHYNPHQL